MQVRGDASLAARLAAKAQLTEVRLLQLDMGLHGELDFEVDYRVETHRTTTWARLDSGLAVQVERGVIIRPSEDGDPLFTTAPRVEARYRLPEGFEFSDEEAEAFIEASALLTVEPYIRELVQSLTVRAGLPPLTLGLTRVPLDDDTAGEVDGETSDDEPAGRADEVAADDVTED